MPRLLTIILAAAALTGAAGSIAAAAECGGEVRMDTDRSAAAVTETMIDGQPCDYTLAVRPGQWLSADLLDSIGLRVAILGADGQVLSGRPTQVHGAGTVTVRVMPDTAALSGTAPLDPPPQRGFTLRVAWSDTAPAAAVSRPAARPTGRAAAPTGVGVTGIGVTGARPAMRSPAANPANVSPPTPVPLTTPATTPTNGQGVASPPVAPVQITQMPVPEGCPANNILNRGVNRVAGVISGDTICRFTIPAGVGRRVTLTDRADSADGLQLVLYSSVSVPLVLDAPVDLPTGQQELRVLKTPATAAPRAAPLAFDLSIRLE